jgi:hypothetical protein
LGNNTLQEQSGAGEIRTPSSINVIFSFGLGWFRIPMFGRKPKPSSS